MANLHEMLTYRRADNSGSETEFIERYIDRPYDPEVDFEGNRIVRVGLSSTLFCAHTDTVHYDDGMQRVIRDGRWLCAEPKADCLGADDGAGIWLMLQMIEAKVPGVYIFHRAEETGRDGAFHIAYETPELLDGIARSIEFDRFGYTSVVTHQCGRRCASDLFGSTLAKAIGGSYKIDPDGMYTDNACYENLIPENVNISVGYFDQHTEMERVNTKHLDWLLKRLLKISWEELPIARKLGEKILCKEEVWDDISLSWE